MKSLLSWNNAYYTKAILYTALKLVHMHDFSSRDPINVASRHFYKGSVHWIEECHRQTIMKIKALFIFSPSSDSAQIFHDEKTRKMIEIANGNILVHDIGNGKCADYRYDYKE